MAPGLPESVADPISPRGKAPLDVEMGAADATGTALQTSLVGNNDLVFFQSVYIGRAEVQTGLVFTFLHTYRTVDNTNMRVLVYTKTV
jgi:hypothetical protein